jgi:membrane-bound lytic murein transglycosylase MltF
VSTKIPDTYDTLIEHAAAEWLPFLDWRWPKAQVWCESAMNPDAVSSVGAEGLGQIMPSTQPEICSGLGLARHAPFLGEAGAENCVRGLAWYDRQMWNRWRAPRAAIERIKLMFASYNAGFGNILDAQELAHGASQAQPILDQLHHVTGEANAKQTREYIDRIIATYERLLIGD